ncbi:MAG: hypothetical protein JNL10_00180 [Verrucomicrobiales bacterium]|nr:hypothetical protein [Verrucomicrobiales bacterium]
MTAATRETRPAFVLLFLSGTAALSHQLVWTRRLVDVLGASAGTFARVVGAFCFGLALGGALAALFPAPARTGWRRMAWAELLVGILGAGVMSAVPLADVLQQGTWTTTTLPWILPAILVIPPAIAMGLVLPAALSAVPEPGFAVRAYAVNTFGGVVGVLMTVFVSLPSFGLLGAGLAACGLSLAIAAGAAVLSCGAPRESLLEDPKSPALPAPRFAGALAFLSGFLVLGSEVVTQHQLAQVTINSHFSSAAILAAILLALAAASAVAGRIRAFPDQAIPPAVFCAAVLWILQPAALFLVRPGLQILPYELAPLPYFLRLGGLAAIAVAPAFAAAGLLFPLLLRGSTSPRTLAAWLALNGLGGWIGAELTQSLVLPALGLWRTPVAAGGAYLVTAILLLASRRHAAHPRILIRPALAALALGGFALWSLSWASAARRPQVSPVPGERVVAVRAGREGVVATVVQDTNDWRIVFNNTYTLGGSRAQFNQERQAHLPLLIHGHAHSVALMGVATGSTLAGAALHPGIERIDAFELSPLAAGFASNWFGPFNRDVFKDPRVQLTVQDARWGIARNPGRYDVILGDLFLPWRTGEGRMYAREQFAAVRKALRPDGLFCQWLPLFQLTRTQYNVITRTFLSEFPNAFLLRGDFYPELPIVGLCAFADGTPLAQVDWSLVRDACDQLREHAPVADPLARHPEGVALCVVGVVPDPGPGPVNTLGNAWLEWDAGRNVVGLRAPWFIGVPEAEYLREVLKTHPGPLPPALREAQDSGQFFLTLEVARRVNAPVFPNLAAQVMSRIPRSLREDPGADWTHWPGQVKPPGSVRIRANSP